ncbi:hypothetical protein KUTeg_021983 [Tegillarca granosa]|uniref:Uncharacterized protein n=1 Tax=Tegillarca granosa TaxID=220873 RepID=A0ABQ9E7W9_TEGGR|nr:hypothetical protein KUTeg_021983 [Tegillarca granosa]
MKLLISSINKVLKYKIKNILTLKLGNQNSFIQTIVTELFPFDSRDTGSLRSEQEYTAVSATTTQQTVLYKDEDTELKLIDVENTTEHIECETSVVVDTLSEPKMKISLHLETHSSRYLAETTPFIISLSIQVLIECINDQEHIKTKQKKRKTMQFWTNLQNNQDHVKTKGTNCDAVLNNFHNDQDHIDTKRTNKLKCNYCKNNNNENSYKN